MVVSFLFFPYDVNETEAYLQNGGAKLLSDKGGRNIPTSVIAFARILVYFYCEHFVKEIRS